MVSCFSSTVGFRVAFPVMLLLVMTLFSQNASSDEFDKFEDKLSAQRLECYYLDGDYIRSYKDVQAMRWAYDGERFSMNGNVLKKNMYRSKGKKIIVDLSKLIRKIELSIPEKGVPLFMQLKYYVDFQKGVSMLTIGDRRDIRGRCRAF